MGNIEATEVNVAWREQTGGEIQVIKALLEEGPAQLQTLIEEYKSSDETVRQNLAKVAQRLRKLTYSTSKKRNKDKDENDAYLLFQAIKNSPEILQLEELSVTELINSQRELDRLALEAINGDTEALTQAGLSEKDAIGVVETVKLLYRLEINTLIIRGLIIALIIPILFAAYLFFSQNNEVNYLQPSGNSFGDPTPAILYSTKPPTPAPYETRTPEQQEEMEFMDQILEEVNSAEDGERIKISTEKYFKIIRMFSDVDSLIVADIRETYTFPDQNIWNDIINFSEDDYPNNPSAEEVQEMDLLKGIRETKIILLLDQFHEDGISYTITENGIEVSLETYENIDSEIQPAFTVGLIFEPSQSQKEEANENTSPEEQVETVREFIEIDENGNVRVDAQRFVYEERAFVLLPNGIVIYMPEGKERDQKDIIAKIEDDMGGGEVILVFKDGTMAHERAERRVWPPDVPTMTWKEYFEMQSNLSDLEPATENGKIMTYIPNPNTPEDPTDVITVGEIENIPASRVVAMIQIENGNHKLILDDGTYIDGTHIKPSDDLDTLESMLTAQRRVMTDKEYDDLVEGHADYAMQLGGHMNKRAWERAMDSFLEIQEISEIVKNIWEDMNTKEMSVDVYDGWWAELNRFRNDFANSEKIQNNIPESDEINELRNKLFPNPKYYDTQKY